MISAPETVPAKGSKKEKIVFPTKAQLAEDKKHKPKKILGKY